MTCQLCTRIEGDFRQNQRKRLGFVLYQQMMAEVDWCIGMLWGAQGSLVWDDRALVGLVTELERPLPACQVCCGIAIQLTCHVPILQ